MPPRADPSATSIRTDLLASIALLFVSAVAVAVGAVAAILPLAASPAAALPPLAVIVLADLAILFFFLRSLLRKMVLDPVDGIVHHAERIASGELDHRIPPAPAQELDRIVESVNTLASRLIDEQARLARNVASLDETNRVLSETSDELVRAARLASVGTLAAGVAHEIGNPLGALRAYLDVLEGRLEQGRPVEGLVGDLRHEASRIDDIVRAILELARPVDPGADPDAPGAPPVPPRFDRYAHVVDAVLADLSRGDLLEGVELDVRIEPDAPAVHAHPQHVERILANLVRNAAQALEGAPAAVPRRLELSLRGEPARPRPLSPRREDDPPSVTYAHRRRLASLLRAERVEPAPVPAEGAPVPPTHGDAPGSRSGTGDAPPTRVELVMEVLDTGSGIPEAHLGQLFDPFFTTREPGTGVGMGLALTARIVHELAGTIEAGPRPDGAQGSRFMVRIPGGAS
jgi:two-component system, NtrC family, sensor kinase